MKRSLITGMLALLLAANFSAKAQNEHPPKVEILPSASGILKILYVNENEHKVKVNISGAGGLIFSDRIFLEENSKGFVKRYNMEQMKPGIYWVEVTNTNMTVKYQFDYLDDKTIFAHYWRWTERSPAGTVSASTKGAH